MALVCTVATGLPPDIAIGRRTRSQAAGFNAAGQTRERIQARLKELEAEEPPIEFRFSLADQWSRHLFVALLRR